MKRTKQGQVTVEAAVLLTFIVAAFVFMGVYLQRGAQGGMKGNADSLGTPFQSTTKWSTVSESQTHSTKLQTNTGQCAKAVSQYGTPGFDDVTGLFEIDKDDGAYTAVTGCTPTKPLGFVAPVTIP